MMTFITYPAIDFNKQLAAVRNLTAPFHDFDTAVNAGWFAPITDCVENPGDPSIGSMGYHYGNPEYLEDGGYLDILQPEVLLYEPQKNGKKRLVGVEYVVPFDDHPITEDPPVLFGQEFIPLPGPGVWGLHVWIWRHNPHGMFYDWNPKVSCKYD